MIELNFWTFVLILTGVTTWTNMLFKLVDLIEADERPSKRKKED